REVRPGERAYSDLAVHTALYPSLVGQARERVGVRAVGEHRFAGVDEPRLGRVQPEGGRRAVAELRRPDPEDRRVDAPLQPRDVGFVPGPHLLRPRLAL